MKLLISSAGSLVAHNLLNALGARRADFEIIGCNSVVDSPIAFGCDRVHHVLPTAASGFRAQIQALLDKEQPDLIVPGRDLDVVFWAEFAESQPEWAARIPVGSRAMAQVLYDKAFTWQFAQAQQWPMPTTLVCGPDATPQQLDDLMAQTHWPLIAKPRTGFGSHGVRLLTTRSEALFFLNQTDWLLQTYLRAPDEVPLLPPQPLPGIPLLPELAPWSQYSAQTLITPTGDLTELFTCQHRMSLGRWWQLIPVDLPALTTLAEQVARSLAAAGWRGPLNIEAKPDPQGRWQVIECNGRLTGATAARYLLGHDELGLLFAHYLPQATLRQATPPAKGQHASVLSLVEERALPPEWPITLAQTGVWEQP